MLEEETVAVLVVPVSWVSQGGLEQTRSAPPMVAVATVAVLVVPVSWVSQGGLEQTRSAPPIVAVATVAVLVVPVSWVSQGGLEQTRVTVTITHDNIRTKGEASRSVTLVCWSCSSRWGYLWQLLFLQPLHPLWSSWCLWYFLGLLMSVTP